MTQRNRHEIWVEALRLRDEMSFALASGHPLVSTVSATRYEIVGEDRGSQERYDRNVQQHRQDVEALYEELLMTTPSATRDELFYNEYAGLFFFPACESCDGLGSVDSCGRSYVCPACAGVRANPDGNLDGKYIGVCVDLFCDDSSTREELAAAIRAHRLETIAKHM